LRWGYKRVLEFARRIKYYQGAVSVGHPKFKEGSQAAAALTANESTPYDAPDIVYDEEDDRAVDEFHRTNAQSSWHGVCSLFLLLQNNANIDDA
jgi:alcohol oxidase